MAVLIIIAILLLAEVSSNPVWYRRQPRTGVTITQTSILYHFRHKFESPSVGTCIRIQDPHNPSMIEVRQPGYVELTIALFSSDNCQGWPTPRNVPLDRYFNNKVLVSGDRYPICSFRLNYPQFSRTHDPNRVTLSLQSGGRMEITNADHCINLCSRSDSQYAFSDYVDIKRLDGSSSSDTISIFSEPGCVGVIRSNVGTGSLRRLTMKPIQSLVRSFQVFRPVRLFQ